MSAKQVINKVVKDEKEYDCQMHVTTELKVYCLHSFVVVPLVLVLVFIIDQC